jgi:hypothetical protein
MSEIKKPVVSGKKPVESASLKYSSFHRNMLDIPPAIAAELKEKGLEGRWINYNEFVKDGNFHRQGWVPFRPEKADSSNGFFFGNNPDGIIRRKELVLASRPKEICDAHRAHLKDAAKRKATSKKTAEAELRQMASDGRLNTRIEGDFGGGDSE